MLSDSPRNLETRSLLQHSLALSQVSASGVGPDSAEADSAMGLLALEFHLHRCVQLRLSDERDLSISREAFSEAGIITQAIGILNSRHRNGQVPYDSVTLARKAVAKFIGLAFYKLGKECLAARGASAALEGPCCAIHCLDGLIQAHAMFGEVLKTFVDAGMDLSSMQTTIDATLVELKTQIVKVSFLQGMAASVNDALSAEHLLTQLISSHFRVEGEPSQYLIQNLNARADELCRIVRESNLSEFEPAFNAKYSGDLSEKGLRNTLKSMYGLLPEPKLFRIVKLVEQQATELQAAAAAAAAAASSAQSLVKPLKTEIAKPAAKRTKAVKPVAPEVTAPASTMSSVISGRFFRGVLEPSDHRFASIADGTHPEVRAYLLERKRQAASQAIRLPAIRAEAKTAKGVKVRVIEDARPAGHNLLERHESAERIGWESQSQYSFGAKKARATAESAPTVVARSVSVSAPMREESSDHVLLDEDSLQWPSASGPDARDVPPSGSRGRRRFTEQETNNLIQGILNFGHDWRRIQQHYKFSDRTNVDLKDKARTLRKQGLL